MSFFIIMIIIGKVQHGSVVLPLWELSARGEGGHSLQPPARPHDHHDLKYYDSDDSDSDSDSDDHAFSK